ncbi:MAG: ABC transporter ATP-binding protein [Ignavibacteria bacterium]|nr:MAG: ABC transporter ATP-binding protein [Ignavibacteria bacterium]
MDPLVRCLNIQKSFTIDRGSSPPLHVLRGINLEILGGEFISVVGASGSGKSTLLHILGGLDRPTEGEVFWLEKNIGTLGDEELARLRGGTVGFVFQFHHLLPEFSALENVMIPIMIQAKSTGEAAARATRLLNRVGLQDRLRHRPSELSGGEQQRVAVARALANNPQIVFADEPTGNLDSVSSQNLHELLRELNRTEKQTFLIVTHNERFARESSRIFRMTDGILETVVEI